MIKFSVLVVLTCIVLTSCDSYPGPVLRNEFPVDIKVSVLYGDGSMFTEQWPSCRTVSIGLTKMGRVGLKDTGESVDQILVEIDNMIVHTFDKGEISQLLEQANAESGYPIWVLDATGIWFSNSRDCSLEKGVN